jgi:hypothetical protein
MGERSHIYLSVTSRQKFLTAKTMKKNMNHLFKRPKTGPKSPKRRRHYEKTAGGTSRIPIRVF